MTMPTWTQLCFWIPVQRYLEQQIQIPRMQTKQSKTKQQQKKQKSDKRIETDKWKKAGEEKEKNISCY